MIVCSDYVRPLSVFILSNIYNMQTMIICSDIVCPLSVFIVSNNDNLRRAVHQQHVAFLSSSRCKKVKFVEQCDIASLPQEQCVSLVCHKESATLYLLLQVSCLSQVICYYLSSSPGELFVTRNLQMFIFSFR